MLIRFAEWILRRYAPFTRTYFVVEHPERDITPVLQWISAQVINTIPRHAAVENSWRVRWL